MVAVHRSIKLVGLKLETYSTILKKVKKHFLYVTKILICFVIIPLMVFSIVQTLWKTEQSSTSLFWNRTVYAHYKK